MSITFPTSSSTLFGSGAASLTPPADIHRLKTTRIAGVDGNYTLKMGKVSGPVAVRGVIIAGTATSLVTLLAAIKSTTTTGTLRGHLAGQTYSNMTLQVFYPSGPMHKKGSKFYMPYAAQFTPAGY